MCPCFPCMWMVSLIGSFTCASDLFDVEVLFPRPNGKGFEYFVERERESNIFHNAFWAIQE